MSQVGLSQNMRERREDDRLRGDAMELYVSCQRRSPTSQGTCRRLLGAGKGSAKRGYGRHTKSLAPPCLPCALQQRQHLCLTRRCVSHHRSSPAYELARHACDIVMANSYLPEPCGQPEILDKTADSSRQKICCDLVRHIGLGNLHGAGQLRLTRKRGRRFSSRPAHASGQS